MNAVRCVITLMFSSLTLLTVLPAHAAAFSELVTVVPTKVPGCRLADAHFDVCPAFKAFPSDLARYDAPSAIVFRLPEIQPFQRSVTKALPKAVWLQRLTGSGQGRFLATSKGNFVTAYLCRPDACDTVDYVFAMDAAYRKKWALRVRPGRAAQNEPPVQLRWFGEPDETVKTVLLAARALHRGESPAY